MKIATLPRILRRRLQTSTSQSTKSLPLPRETHHFGASSNPPRTPANVFATLTYSCACHAFWNVSKSLRLPREKHFERQKVVRDPGALTILTSKSCWRAGVVQIFGTSTSKSAPTPSVFNDFDFRIVLARRRGAYFADFNFQKCSRTVSFLTILTSESFWRAGVVQILATSTSKSARHLSVFNDFDFRIALARRRGANFVTSWATDPPHPPVLRTWLFESAKPQNYGKTQHFAHFLPAKSSCLTSLLYHICAIASLDWQIFSSNFQYSRKLDS